ncbi:MAG: ribonuclease R [Christensenellales bacterium]|jgi:ribonuclease R
MENRELIMEIIAAADKPLMAEEIIPASGLDYGKAGAALRELTESGELMITKKGKYALPKQVGLMTGRLQVNPRGFGFLLQEGGDVFIPAPSLNGGMNGDIVAVRQKGGGDREGEVVSVLSRANSMIIGVFKGDARGGVVVSDDARLNEVEIPAQNVNGAIDGYKVVAAIVRFATANAGALGRIDEVLGAAGEADTDMKALMRQFSLNDEFPKQAMKEAASAGSYIEKADIEGREDLRDMIIFTIDGADAKDLDDAISISMENGVYTLGVHIADVSHYVKTGSALDQEALRRGTSVYFPGSVIPMLPPTLSNGICSLNRASDRLTMSCFMDIDETGKVIDYRISQSVIRTAERMTYDDVNAIFDRDRQLMDKYEHLLEHFNMMRDLMGVLYAARERRGSIEFNVPEADITLGKDGRATLVKKRERGEAEHMIEEFMIAANETICSHLHWSGAPCIYRIHERPDEVKMTEFARFIGELGYRLPKKSLRPKTLQKLLQDIKGREEEGVISRLMLRSMQKAKYSERNAGHFGLASEFYAHFTSPIRRYPDLLLHRILKAQINGQAKKFPAFESHMPEVASQCSERERNAMDAERAAVDIKKCEYLESKIGKSYKGIISGVSNAGIFVELDNTCEGLVRMEALRDDYYEYNEARYLLQGRRKKKIYRLGDKVRIVVTGVDMHLRKAQFELYSS